MFVSDVASELNVAPGSVVVVRDEEWLVTNVEQATDGALISVRGLTELVKDAPAMFYEALDKKMKPVIESTVGITGTTEA